MPPSHLQLILRYEESDASPEEVERLSSQLRACPEARETIRDVSLQALAASELRASRFPLGLSGSGSGNGTPMTRHPDRPVFIAVAAAIAAIIAIASTIVVANRSEPPVAKLTEVQGDVRWTGDAGSILENPPISTPLSGGTLRITSDDAAATLAFDDGSRLTFTGPTEATIARRKGQNWIRLDDGSLSASIEPQPRNRPFRIETSVATLEVLGTRFDVESGPAATWLAVSEGAVRLTRRIDGQAVEVPAEHQVLASLSSGDFLRLQPRPTPVDAWQSRFDLGPAGTRGQWLPPSNGAPARLRATPKLLESAHRQPHTIHQVACRVSSRNQPPVQVLSGTRIRLEGRSQRPARLVCMLGTQHPDGGFAGNFFHDFAPLPDPDTGVWTVELKIPDFDRQRPSSATRELSGLIVKKVVIYTRSATAQPELEAIHILPGA